MADLDLYNQIGNQTRDPILAHLGLVKRTALHLKARIPQVMDVDELIVAEAYVGKNLVMKRGRPRARGRFGALRKPFSELTIKVREIEEQA
jgi:hypothetical protein